MGAAADPTLSFPSAAAFEAWLEDHHAESAGIWLRIAKKGAAEPSVSYAEAIEVALCFGWIDGQKNGLDDHHWLQRFTPRTRRSRWSRINRDKAERLIADGRMRPAGLRAVEEAREDGRWEAAYAGARTAEVPPELQRELDADPALAAEFAGLNSANRYAIIWRINDAKRPETRARRVEKYVEMLRRGERLHP